MSLLSVNFLMSDALATIDDHVDKVRVLGDGDGEDALTRSSRSVKPDTCKYKKGEWSPCDQMLMVRKTENIYYSFI